MLWHNCQFLYFFLCFFRFYEVNADITCQEGQMAAYSRDKCVPCPENQFQPKPSKLIECFNCLPCGIYSENVSACTPTRNTKCRCFEGFTPLEDTHEKCECNKGSGIKSLENGKVICEKCPNGTFTSKADSACKKWKQCGQSGEEVPGSSTFDVKCKIAMKKVENGVITTIASISETSKALYVTRRTTTEDLKNSDDLYTTTFPAINKHHGLWLGVLVPALLLILILCTTVKLRARQGTCRKPVEESGAKLFSPVVQSC